MSLTRKTAFLYIIIVLKPCNCITTQGFYTYVVFFTEFAVILMNLLIILQLFRKTEHDKILAPHNFKHFEIFLVLGLV